MGLQQKKLGIIKNLTEDWSREGHSSWGKQDESPSAVAAQLHNSSSDSLNPD